MTRADTKDNSRKDITVEFLKEFWYFIRSSKKFWLLPIIIILLALSAFILLTESTVLAPFIYAIF